MAAVGGNGVIGVEGRLPWRIPDDLARFKRMTIGNAVVMGRATYESIGKPLPDRLNIVLSRRPGLTYDGVVVVGSLEEALDVARSAEHDLFVAGGSDVYRLALPISDRMELTEVAATPEGDTWFPDVDWSDWSAVHREEREGFAFVTYVRKGA